MLSVQITPDGEGAEPRELEAFSDRGRVFGEVALVASGRRRTASIVALALTTAYSITRAQFHGLFPGTGTARSLAKA